MKSYTLSAIRACLSVACVGAIATTALAQTKLAKQKQGRQIAERLCSNCHDVSPNAGSTVSHPARSFKSIAGRPGQSPTRLAGAIIIPHPEMPNVALTRVEIRNVVAYIQSLKASE